METQEKGTEAQTTQGTESQTPENLLAPKNLRTPPESSDTDMDVLLADLEMGDSPPAQNADDSEQGSSPGPSDREKELLDRLSEQGRELKELRTLITQQQQQSPLERHSTGDPEQDNINLLADAYVELENKINSQHAQSEQVSAYMDEGFSRAEARDLIALENSRDVADRIAWRKAYNAGLSRIEQAKQQQVRQQQYSDFSRTQEGGRATSAQRPNTVATPAQFAKSIKEKYPTWEGKQRALETLEHSYGEDFADETLSLMNDMS